MLQYSAAHGAGSGQHVIHSDKPRYLYSEARFQKESYDVDASASVDLRYVPSCLPNHCIYLAFAFSLSLRKTASIEY